EFRHSTDEILQFDQWLNPFRDRFSISVSTKPGQHRFSATCSATLERRTTALATIGDKDAGLGTTSFCAMARFQLPGSSFFRTKAYCFALDSKAYERLDGALPA